MESEVVGAYEEQSEYKAAEKRLEAIGITYPPKVLHEAMASFLAGMNGSYVGLVMENIEALGLSERQEVAVKKLLKNQMYDLLADLQSCVHEEINLFNEAMNDPTKNDPDGYDLDEIHRQEKEAELKQA